MLIAEDRETRVFDRKEHFIGGNWHTARGGDLLDASRPKGWYIEPTIFTDVDNRMEIAQVR